MFGGLTFWRLSCPRLVQDGLVPLSTTCGCRLGCNGTRHCPGRWITTNDCAPWRNNRLKESLEKNCSYEITSSTWKIFGKTQARPKLSKCISGPNTWVLQVKPLLYETTQAWTALIAYTLGSIHSWIVTLLKKLLKGKKKPLLKTQDKGLFLWVK